ncbi:MAG: helix-turn-helix domain-containing protein [Pseudomonadota bacterium]
MVEPPKIKDANPSGLLHKAVSLRHFSLDLYEPPEELAALASNIWHVHWALPEGETYEQENLPHPVQHIVLDPTRGSGLFGCGRKRFSYTVYGTSQVIGLKLRPGMGRAFYDGPLAAITGERVPLGDLVGLDADRLVDQTREGAPLADILPGFKAALCAVAGAITEPMRMAGAAVRHIEAEQDVRRVSDVAGHLGLGVRQTQRLFADYVGVSPKWVIARYRMLEAVDTLNAGEAINLSALALDLGYADQAHFSNQFKDITGVSPAAYLKA